MWSDLDGYKLENDPGLLKETHIFSQKTTRKYSVRALLWSQEKKIFTEKDVSAHKNFATVAALDK